jgi:hypothetical protein
MAFFAAFGWFAWWICSVECSRLGARVRELLAENDELRAVVAAGDLADLEAAETPGDIGWRS